MKMSYWIGALSLLVILAFSAPASRLAIWPHDVHIEGDLVQVYRSFPADWIGLPRPRLSYIETVKGITPETHAGHVCEERGGPFRYSTASDVGQWSIAWAAPCLADPVAAKWEACWTWHLGLMRFGATCKTHVIFTEAKT